MESVWAGNARVLSYIDFKLGTTDAFWDMQSH